MDYGRLNRRELQALCKEHGIAANKTNVFMAEALAALRNVPKEGKLVNEDPAEVVKARSRRTVKKKNLDDVLAPTVVEELSSHLAQSTLSCPFAALGGTVPVEEDAAAQSILFSPSPALGGTVPVEEDAADVEATAVEAMKEEGYAAEPVDEAITLKARRKPRTQSLRKGLKFKNILADVVHTSEASTDAAVESAWKTLSELGTTGMDHIPRNPVDKDDVWCTTHKHHGCERYGFDESECQRAEEVVAAPQPAPQLYSRRGHKKQDGNAVVVSVLELPATAIAPSDNPRTVLEHQVSEDVTPGFEKIVSVDSVAPAPEHCAEEAAIPVKAVAKPKGRRTKKPIAAAPEISEAEFAALESPPFVIPLGDDLLNASSALPRYSPTKNDLAFEFQPVAASFAEIMDEPQLPTQEGVIECTHRRPGRAGKACRSCESERKVADLMLEVQTLNDHNNAGAQEGGGLSSLEASDEATESAGETKTPAKAADNKENSVKAINLQTLSIRKLQKEVRKRGLSKRSNVAAPIKA